MIYGYMRPEIQWFHCSPAVWTFSIITNSSPSLGFQSQINHKIRSDISTKENSAFITSCPTNQFWTKSSQVCAVLQHRPCSPVTASIRFKILLLAFKALHEFGPDYLWTLPLSHTNLVLRTFPTALLTIPHRTRHSQSS